MNDLLACPLCHSGLILHAAGWVCPTDGACYTLHASGLVDFRPEASRAAGDEFARRYREARLAEGVRPLTREDILRLPNGHPSGYTRVYWSVRRESLAALWTLLPVAGETLSIADLGAGIPWLSHRLAERHHRVIAVDLSPDADFGLGAARHFPTAVGLPPVGDEAATLLPAGRFFPVLGDLENPPLATGRFDCVMCNASLHYARDLTSALRRIAAAVRPGGAVIVMDSPLGEQPRPSASGGRVLGRHELMDALHQAGLVATWHDVARGWLWRRRQIKNRLLRRVGFDFPLIIAEPRHKSPSPEE